MGKRRDEPDPVSDESGVPADTLTDAAPGNQSTAQVSDEEISAMRVESALALPELADGEIIAGRYRVVRYLARGGMGEIYEAEDLELAERVALKTIRAQRRDAVAEERFKREIQLSRKVTHPNVCRIFDVGFHKRDKGAQIVFLTMELLSGETLFDRIRREGALPIGDMMGVLRQISAGLTAAHAAGVVHRDLKSGNVMLVPQRDGAVRAVVTDFGLAHVLGGGEHGAHTLSGSGEVVGTPGYMAPEQIEGGPLTARTDVYALGIVMYEMITGKLPFDGATPLSIAVKRLTTPAPSPRKLRPDLHPRFERAVLACLERDPASRPATARGVLELLGMVSESVEEIDGTIRVPRLRRRIPLVRPALAMLVIAIGLIAFQRYRERPTIGPRRAIAAIPFHPVDEAAAKQPWIGVIAAELLAVQLGASDTLQSFDSESLAGPLRDIGVIDGAEFRLSHVDRLRNLLAIDLVVMGRYAFDERARTVTIDASLIDAHSKRGLAQVHETGSADAVTGLLSRVAARIGAAAGVTASQAARGISVTLPQAPRALRDYSEARALLDRHELAGAIAAARNAVAAEPGHARSHLLLADALREAGDDRAARAEGKRAVELAGGLPPQERIYVEAVASSLTHDRHSAITRLEGLRREVPNDFELGERLAVELVEGGRALEALALIERLRSDALSKLASTRLDLIESDAASVAGDLERAGAAARRASITANELGARLRRAQARYRSCRVLDSQHRAVEARAACEEARRDAAEAGERRLRALAVNMIANIDFSLGEIDEARRGYEELLPVFRDIGDTSSQSMVLNNLGNIASADGDRQKAAALWRESLQLIDEVNDDLNAAPTRENLSELLWEDGKGDEALQLSERAQQAWRGADDTRALLSSSCRTAGLYAEMGRGREAERRLDEVDALAARLPRGAQDDIVCNLVRADLELGRGRPGRAVEVLRGLATLLEKSGERDNRWSVGVALANALAEAGDAAAARRQLDLLGEAIGARAEGLPVRYARVLRLRLDAERGPVSGGAARLRAIASGATRGAGLRTELGFAIELERARAALGDHATAVQKLHALSSTATKIGFVSLALQAELYEHELRARAGKRPGRTEVIDYARRARAAGRPGWADRVEHLLEA